MPDNVTYTYRKSLGVCTRCGHQDALQGHIACEACRDKQRAYSWWQYHRFCLGENVTPADYRPRAVQRRMHGAA